MIFNSKTKLEWVAISDDLVILYKNQLCTSELGNEFNFYDCPLFLWPCTADGQQQSDGQLQSSKAGWKQLKHIPIKITCKNCIH